MDKIADYIFAGVILVFWLAFFFVLLWDEKKGKRINILMGLASFVFVGAAYIFPFWLIIRK